MKEEINELFRGMTEKLPLNLLCGFGVGLLTQILVGLSDLDSGVGISGNLLYMVLNQNPILFWISFSVGFLWSNSLIKEMQKITLRKLFIRLPLILVWIIAILLSSAEL
jgi:hypothetical protein